MSGATHNSGGSALRKMLIVLCLIAGLVLLHRFGVRSAGFDPSAMLALGFVILASYAFGQLLGRIGLPHLTGYILAGLALGPSAAHYLPPSWQVAPFDQGVLSESVISQLRVFETLAVGLIALIAGGELRLSLLRRGLSSVAGMIVGHLLVVGPLAFGFIAIISGLVPSLRMPGLGGLTPTQLVAIGVTVASVVIATSPAATVAVVAETRSAGPITGVIMAAVVLMDVVIVVLFSVSSTIAAQMLGLSESGELGLYLLQHIGGSIVVGGVVGAVMILYLRFVRAELLLFLLALLFTAAFIANQFSLELVLLFIAAGFVAVNFSSEGEALVGTVEKLFLPVSVVFFTLAGARLHLDVVIQLAPFALTMVAVRALGIFFGTRLGLKLARANDDVRRFAWVGFVPQAGVALALAAIVGRNFSEVGLAFETLLVAGIALNELIGPVMLKLGLVRSGEVGKADQASSTDSPAVAEVKEERQQRSLRTWSPPPSSEDTWGAPLASGSPPLDTAVNGLTDQLAQLAQRVQDGSLARFREEALAYIRELRREFLRHHRRVTLAVTQGNPAEVSAKVRLEEANLADKWRAAVLRRSSDVQQQPRWEAQSLLDSVETIIHELPVRVMAPYQPTNFRFKASDGPLAWMSRLWLHLRRLSRRLVGLEMSQRSVNLRGLSQWHLWGLLPKRLAEVAAHQVYAEWHLVARTQSTFEMLVRAYDELDAQVQQTRSAAKSSVNGGRLASDTSRPSAPPPATSSKAGSGPISADSEVTRELEAQLREIQEQITQELTRAVRDIEHIVEDLGYRTREALGEGLRGLKRDIPIVGTADLPLRRRATSGLYKQRRIALRALGQATPLYRESSEGLYNRLALEMELVGLERRIKEALDDHARSLERDIEGRAFRQLQRVHEALNVAAEQLESLISNNQSPAELARQLREACAPAIHTCNEASQVIAAFHHELTDERPVGAMLDRLNQAAQDLADHYYVLVSPLPDEDEILTSQMTFLDVPFLEWVHARIETTLAPHVLASTEAVAKKVAPLRRALSELERRIAFNVELAASELSVGDEFTPAHTRQLLRKIVGERLERDRDAFGQRVADARRWRQDVMHAVTTTLAGALQELRTGIVDEDLGRVRQRMLRDVQRLRLLRFVQQLHRSIQSTLVVTSRALYDAVGPAHWDLLRSKLGLSTRRSITSLDRALAPVEPTADVPIVYRRLFSARALEAGDLFVTGGAETLQHALDVLTGTIPGRCRAVAIVGPDGVGKSAFLHALVRARRWPKVRELLFDAPASVEQVEAFFDTVGEGQLFVVENLHWLRRLEPGGFEPLRLLIAKIIADGGKNAFVLRADHLIWEQCKEVVPLRDAFPEVVQLDPLDSQALTAAVLARHALSGYRLVFKQGATPNSGLEDFVLKAISPLVRPKETFFRALHAASGGLLRDALRLWLASVERVDEATECVYLGPVPAPRIYALRTLDDEDVLALYQIARQGWMDARGMAFLFRTDATVAAARLAALADLGLIERRAAVWRVAVHLRGAIRQLLEERGYLP